LGRGRKWREGGVTRMDPGVETVRRVFELLQVDTGWSRWEERGFVWVAHRRPQRVWAEPPRADLGVEVTRVHAQTPVAAVPEVAWRRQAREAEYAAGLATLSGLVYEGGVLRLWCGMWVHRDTVAWVARVLAGAALLQLAEAEADDPAKWHGTEVVDPEIGVRPQPDEMLVGLPQLLGSKGRVELSEQEREETVRALRGAGVFATHGPSGLSAEFPVGVRGGPVMLGGESDLLVFSCDEPHPVVGGGVLVRLHPWREAVRSGRRLRAWELNGLEYHGRCRAYFLGSWCRNPRGGQLAFVSFVPAFLWQPGMLWNFAFSMGARSKWLQELS